MKLSEQTNHKFINTVDLSDTYEVWTDTGWEDLKAIHQTVPYTEWDIECHNGMKITVADTHIFFTSNLEEVYAKDSLGVELYTESGPSVVVSVIKTEKVSNMFDLSVASENNRYYTNNILSHNSVSTCAYLLWYALFHSEKTIAVLANKGATAREMLSRITLMLENLPFFLQPGCKALNKGNIDFSNNSRIISAATSSSSIRGLSISLLYLDEFGFVDNANTFYTGVYPVVTSGKDTKVIITSTANGVGNMFYKLWEGAVQKTNEFVPFTIKWSDVPGRDEAWKKQTISNTSELQFQQEYGCEFLGSNVTLISSSTLLGLQSITPLKTQYGIKYYAEPIAGHDYILTADVSKGRGQDYSTFTVIDISCEGVFKQVCTYRDNLISPLLFPEMIVRAAKIYNNALVIIENNDAGMVVCNSVYYDYEYDNTFVESSTRSNGIGVTMTKRVKRIGCSNLKDLLENGKLHLVDEDSIIELSTFEPKGDSYAASNGTHDDMVMNLVMFSWFVSTSAFGGMSNVDIKELMYAEKLREMEEDIVPFGIISNSENVEKTQSQISYEAQVASLKEWNGL